VENWPVDPKKIHPDSTKGKLRIFLMDLERGRKTRTNAFKNKLLQEDFLSSSLERIGAMVQILRSWHQFENKII
jgi:hypothetical protein